MEGLSSLTSMVLTAVKSTTILVVHVSVLGGRVGDITCLPN